ncbi:hypothetical protein DL767_010440 [Monosporascus sp. MG133]|nr:hypothetical protein DL767_010440 [Monosporascus sp. MG133]
MNRAKALLRLSHYKKLKTRQTITDPFARLPTAAAQALTVTTRQSGRLTVAQVTCSLAAFAQVPSGANHPELTPAQALRRSTAVPSEWLQLQPRDPETAPRKTKLAAKDSLAKVASSRNTASTLHRRLRVSSILLPPKIYKKWLLPVRIGCCPLILSAELSSYGRGVVEAALLDGLPTELSGIDPHPVRRNLKPNSKKAYLREMEIWNAYLNKFPGSDPCNMQVMKHFAEVIGRGIKARLEARVGRSKTERGRATTFSVRNKMRRFYNMWEREMHIAIPEKVKNSMAPYIDGKLAEKIGLSREKKTPTFFTVESYVNLQLYHWVSDHHDYKHEGSRVDASNLLNIHCFTSARLREDLFCLVGRKNGQPDIKLDFKRKICKGLDYKQPEHPLAERLEGPDGLPPPLFAQPMLHWLVNIISARAFRDYQTIEDVLNVIPEEGESFCFLDWADDMLNKPVFPEWSESGPEDKAKNDKAWGNQVSQWAKRAGFINGLPIHAIRREILIKVNGKTFTLSGKTSSIANSLGSDSGASMGQVAQFAAQRNLKTLVGHYLHSLTTIDGAACFLEMQPRNDLTQDFRTATMKRNPDLRHSLPSKMQAELESRDDYAALTRQIENLSLQIKTATDQAALTRLRDERSRAYKNRAQLEHKEQEKFRQSQKRVPKTEREAHRQSDWQKTHFNRIRHMMPERNRLAQTLSRRAPLRSPDGISVMKDLIALRTGDCRVAYQDVLRPVNGVCPAPDCDIEMKSILHPLRWKHVFACYESFLERNHGYAQFCFLCSRWINSETEWERHCQTHIDDGDAPSRCDPVIFRYAVACAGYCPVHLGNEGLPACERLQQFTDRSAWRRHISHCIPDYVATKAGALISCPLSCRGTFHSEADLWHHLGDVHSTHLPRALKKRKSRGDSDGEKDFCSSSSAKKRKIVMVPADRRKPQFPKIPVSTNLVNASAEDTGAKVFLRDASELSGSSLSIAGGDHNVRDRSVASISTTGATEQQRAADSGTNTPLSSLFDSDTEVPEESLSEFLIRSPSTASPAVCDVTLPVAPTQHTVPMELIHPELRNDAPPPGYVEGVTTKSAGDGVVHVPTAIDEVENVWEVETLLAKWQRGRKAMYLVKWKGFVDKDNTWERPADISAELVNGFDKAYRECGGNNLGVELLNKRERRGNVEYYLGSGDGHIQQHVHLLVDRAALLVIYATLLVQLHANVIAEHDSQGVLRLDCLGDSPDAYTNHKDFQSVAQARYEAEKAIRDLYAAGWGLDDGIHWFLGDNPVALYPHV